MSFELELDHDRLMRHVNNLTARVQVFSPSDWVSLSYASGRWVASTFYTNMRHVSTTSPFEALAALDEEIARREGADKALARTLGVAAE